MKSTSSPEGSSRRSEPTGSAGEESGASHATGGEEGPEYPLSLYTQNCYLVPPFLTFNSVFWNCTRQAARGGRIGRIAAEHDIVCLQEVWGAGLRELQDELEDTHRVEQDFQGWVGGIIGGIIGPIRTYCAATGGLLQAWRPDILTFEHAGKRPFRQSLPLANQNVTCVEFTLGASPSGLSDAPSEGKMQEAVQAANELAAAVRMEPRLYVFNAHFNVLGSERRRKNLSVLKNFVTERLWEEFIYNQGRKDLTGVYILIMGDFNIDSEAHPNLYGKLMTLDHTAECRDLFDRGHNPFHKHIQSDATLQGIPEDGQQQGPAEQAQQPVHLAVPRPCGLHHVGGPHRHPAGRHPAAGVDTPAGRDSRRPCRRLRRMAAGPKPGPSARAGVDRVQGG
uniref:Endonuclease/exonuclease/phosphatase domain-containing protein n=1 Tax=Vitrella brassicaformis TaxID=1169539 RepID=A0A7S1JU05_9ALVE|mmetsp:Transcript_23145/g.57232  ORF Transcript_23145/g.57232 Transcript_23145/m.57232 type:complete len:394 (+) Transcript_23145:40-1221(+)